jgi:hypothetical protein
VKVENKWLDYQDSIYRASLSTLFNVETTDKLVSLTTKTMLFIWIKKRADVSHLWQEEVTGGQRNIGQRANINYSDPFGYFWFHLLH